MRLAVALLVAVAACARWPAHTQWYTSTWVATAHPMTAIARDVVEQQYGIVEEFPNVRHAYGGYETAFVTASTHVDAYEVAFVVHVADACSPVRLASYERCTTGIAVKPWLFDGARVIDPGLQVPDPIRARAEALQAAIVAASEPYMRPW